MNRFLDWFGKVIRPVNWMIFLLGLAFVGLSVYQLVWEDVQFIDFLILLATGLGLTADGYGEAKEDEDV